MSETKHRLWYDFARFARSKNVSLAHRDDWLPWWEFSLAGARAINSTIPLLEDD